MNNISNNMANISIKNQSLKYSKLLNDSELLSSNISNSNRIDNESVAITSEPNNNFQFGNYDYDNGINQNNSSIASTVSSLSQATPPLSSSSSSIFSSTANQSLQYQFDYGTHSNDSIQQNYEQAGSNFMLLLEDFGEYFYNYNNTNIGITNVNNNSSVGYEFQSPNATNGIDGPGKQSYLFKFIREYIDKRNSFIQSKQKCQNKTTYSVFTSKILSPIHCGIVRHQNRFELNQNKIDLFEIIDEL